MVDDARYRTKVFLDTYIRDAQITKDDNTTEASWISCYTNPPYPITRVFFDPKNVDLIYFIDQPTSSPSMVDWDGYITGYTENVDVIIQTTTKQDITGSKLLWKALAELRYVLENNPLGSYRSYKVSTPFDEKHGVWIINGVKVTITYDRDTT